MDSPILAISERGQVTIPQKIREQIHVKYFVCKIEGDHIVLEPLQTKEEFLEELKETEQEWKAKGGLTMKEIKKKYRL